MKNRINKNTSVNTKSYYNEQQIVRVLDSYVISKSLRYLIDGNELVTSLFQSKSNLMSISKEAGILVRADGEIYLNKSSSSISICGLVDHMSLAGSLGGYSAITHDLKIALEQVLENKEKITKHTVIFPYHITAIHWVLGEIQLNFDKNTHNLITANLNIYNSLKSEKNTIQWNVKKEISDLIKNLFACPELELIIDLIFTGQQDDVFSCGAIGAENGKGIIDGDIQSKLKINYHSDNATLLRIRHIREVNCERFDDMQLADEQWQNPEFQADQSYLKKIISALEKSKLDIVEILQKHDAISFGKFIKSSKAKIGDNRPLA
ncbi:hypothetical protein [Candidatus Lariskella endosymbiont of Epinotia ramella]|uniref:hypothetical protein n=1 Tax=Candidatus Lariskella endosymbiont of Epinotia ramella TaxID=3066224 RepID=UPI0030D57AF5